jgi:hypothetical protein
MSYSNNTPFINGSSIYWNKELLHICYPPFNVVNEKYDIQTHIPIQQSHTYPYPTVLSETFPNVKLVISYLLKDHTPLHKLLNSVADSQLLLLLLFLSLVVVVVAVVVSAAATAVLYAYGIWEPVSN